MSWQKQDLRRVRAPLLAAGLSALLALALTGGAWWLRDRAQQRSSLAANTTGEAETRASAAMADRANLAAYQARFDQLKQRSVIGMEQRLPWVEYFTSRSESGNPAELELKIEPRRSLEDPPESPEPLENLQFYASKLILSAKLLHEGDAIQLLQRLHDLQGAAIIRLCEIKRAQGAASVRPYLLEMECSGDIITLDAPPAEAAQ
ncbi:hypothetical protein FNU76_09105 [Chitinimonas arctica]|uniref:PilN domain-containing protein n=1 Tax=Chitinimonas arctica TaxID=2594795 RepID=A0A516SEC4_9NEIS|nr:hypothetical protein [Chitinimonas arctica]QDQ26514.1 hypothetical protein FNU76_09105 [Chitinimonas arctica]